MKKEEIVQAIEDIVENNTESRNMAGVEFEAEKLAEKIKSKMIAELKIHILDRIEAVEDGHESAVDLFEYIGALESLAKECKEQVKPLAVQEAENEHGGKVDRGDYRLDVFQATRYEYQYPSFIQEGVIAKREYEKLAKMQKAGLTYPSPEGEEVEVTPAKKKFSEATLKRVKK